MKTIPQVREELLTLAKDLPRSQSRRVKALVKQLYRRPAVRRASNESVEVTQELLRRIRSFARSNPALPYKKIANRFACSISAVSYAIAGKRAA